MNTGAGLLVIARWLDGQMSKGTTHDFSPTRHIFHMSIPTGVGPQTVEIPLHALKAVFFVKSFEGDPTRPVSYDFDATKGQGRRVIVTFLDGEIMAGFTVSYTQGKPGFFLIPADQGDNNERVFVVNAAVKTIQWVTVAPAIPARNSRS